MAYRIEDSRLLLLAENGARNGWPLIPVPFIVDHPDSGGWLVPCTTYLNPEEDVSISLDCIAHIAEDSYLGFTIGEQGFESLHYESDTGLLSYLLTEGIAPGQNFYALVTVHSSRSYEGEYDDYWASAPVWSEPLSAFGHERAWEEWMVEHSKALRMYADEKATTAARMAQEQYWFVYVARHQYTDDISATLRSTVAPIHDPQNYFHSSGAPLVNNTTVALTSRLEVHSTLPVDKIELAGWGAYPIVAQTERLAKLVLENLIPAGEGYHLSMLSVTAQVHGRKCWVLPSADTTDSEWRIADANDRLEGDGGEEGELAWA